MNPQQLKAQLYTKVDEMVLDVVQQLRNKGVTNIPNTQYMALYNHTFQFQGPQLPLFKEIFIEWLQSFLLHQVVPNLLATKDFVETFLFEFNLCKSLLKYFSTLFKKYESDLGIREVYLIEVGLDILDRYIMHHDSIKQRYLEAFVNLLDQIRKTNQNNDKQTLKNFLYIFDLFSLSQRFRMEIDVFDGEVVIRTKNKANKRPNSICASSTYESYLFQPIADGLKRFYSQLSINWIQNGSSTEYIKKVFKQHQLETELCKEFYYVFGKKQEDLLKIIIFELLEIRSEQIIQHPVDGLQQLFIQLRNANELRPIKQMYELYKLTTNHLTNIQQEFQTFIFNQINQIFAEQPALENKQGQKPQMNPNQLIGLQLDNLILFQEYTLKIVEECFENSHRFKNYMEIYFKEKLNQIDKFVEKLTFYININIKDKLRETNNDEDRMKFQKFNKNIQSLINFANNKGKLFQKITSHLKERIFRGEIKNLGFEEEFLKELRKRHPEHLPSDLLTVWKDFKLYRNQDIDITNQIEKSKICPGINFQFTVFTRTNTLSEFNQLNRMEQILVSKQLQPAIAFMEQYFKIKQQTEKKTLIWNYQVGIAHITVRFGPTPQQVGKFIVSNQQLFILLAINERRQISRVQLIQDTGLTADEELTKQLEPLIDQKFVIFDNNNYSLQKEMNKLKIKLIPNKPLPLLPKKIGDNQEDFQMLKKERDIKIQSNVVRIMKTHKEMLYPQLLQGVQKGLLGYYDFSAADILAQIDELINGGYIRRDERINNKFIYTPS